MGRYSSTKVYDGFSTVFRQWKADTTHCQYVHGYGVSFKVWFEGELGAAKRSKHLIDGKTPKEWMAYMFDHTMIIAEDDPYLKAFEQMGEAGVAQVRILPAVGAEKFAEYVFEKMNSWVQAESEGRVRVAQVEFKEHEKNSALYRP